MIKKYFEPVDLSVSFPELEEKLLDFWYKKQIVKKYLRKNRNSQKYFSFLDGPITANNPMGVHHAWGRTYKDLWQRFYNMKGYRQRFQNGFDCQGLWVEVEVEKELGLKTKKEIEALVPSDREKSIAKFVELCKERVYRFAKIQTEQSKRLGYFMDWDNSYYTLSEDNNYMIWHFLKKCHQNGLIYKGSDVVPWCPRCETAISEHEILTEDYRELVHDSLYLKFPVKGRNEEFLLVWTTTPWTVPANVSIAVDERQNYLLVKDADGMYWVGEKLAKSLFPGKKIVKKVKGKKLVSLRYETPFDDLPAVSDFLSDKNFHSVIATDRLILPISEVDGTGLVHVSTGTGAEDHKLGKKFNLPVIAAISDDASYLQDFGFLAGKNAKKDPNLIIDYLKSLKGGLFLWKVEKYKHRYPVCWRCKQELVFKLTDEWYIAMDKPLGEGAESLTLREKMIRVAKKIKWIPEFGLEREIDWLKNMHDWLISKKNRYWGLALPIWECETCGFFDVIGGKDELKKRAVEGFEKFEGKTPHRPYVDKVKISCSKCGRKMGRILDVGNPWLDAGIVPFSTISKDNKGKPLYLIDKKAWRKWFPADFITESFPGQFKNWFYSLIAMSTVLENENPFKLVLGFATLLAEDGRPMHKSLGNAIEFNEGAKKIGVDVMRWMYLRQNPAENLLFGYKIADEVRRRFHLKLWNIYNFFITYANLDGWVPKKVFSINKRYGLPVLDKWILSLFIRLTREVDESLKKYDASTACKLLEEFVDDFSNWYIRRSRGRVGINESSQKNRNFFYETCFFVLVNLAKILAPFTPFISEMIYRNLTKKASVHLEDWPYDSLRKERIDTMLLENMKLVRQVVELAHGIRKNNNIPVRTPLRELFYSFEKDKPDYNPKLFQEIIADEINVKKVVFLKRLIKTSQAAKFIRVVSEKIPKFGKVSVSMNIEITDDLIEEAKTRELIRKIQSLRKKMGISLTQKVKVSSPWLPTRKNLLERIKKRTLAKKLSRGEFSVEVDN